jgi:hypothetical protein
MKAPPLKAARVCRNALRRGTLQICRAGNCIGWKFGRRVFSAETVKMLILAGEAERIGDIVRMVT